MKILEKQDFNMWMSSGEDSFEVNTGEVQFGAKFMNFVLDILWNTYVIFCLLVM